MKRKIIFNLDNDNKPYNEHLSSENIMSSAFSEQYRVALSQMDEYFLSLDINPSYEPEIDHDNNIFAFLGDRGSGKTSCMVSLGEYLQCNRQERSKLDMYANLNSHDFFSLDLIDPSYFDNQHNIITLVLAKLYAAYKEKAHNNNDLQDNRRREFLSALAKTQRHVQQMFDKNITDCLDMSIEQLENLSAAVDLKCDIKNLVDCFFNCFNMSGTILLLRVDDIDLNMSEAGKMMEYIRKYFIQPNILVLVAFKIEQLEEIKKCEFKTNYLKGIDDDGIVAMVERYMTKLIPYSHRIFMPEITNFLGCSFELIHGNNVVAKFNTIKQAVPQLVFAKTRYLFYNTPVHSSYIIPRNLRELRQLVKLLWCMDDYEEVVKADGEIIKCNVFNKERFKRYIIDTWIVNNISRDQYKNVCRVLDIDDPLILNAYMTSLLDELGGNSWERASVEEEELILSKNNNACNISCGDVLALMDYYGRSKISEADQRYLFLLKTFYSIRLYEAYDDVTDLLKSRTNNNSSSKSDIEEHEVLLNPQYKVLGTLDKIFAGAVFNTRLTNLLPESRKLVANRKISGTELVFAMKECMRTSDGNQQNGALMNLCEFFMLGTAYDESIDKKYRQSNSIAYQTPISLEKGNELTFDIGAFFFNLTRIDKCYERFRGLAFIRKSRIDFVDFVKSSPYSLIEKFRIATIDKYFSGDTHNSSIPETLVRAKWLSYCTFRNAEVLQDFVNTISQVSYRDCRRDFEVLRNFFEACSKYSIETYDYAGGTKHYCIEFGYLHLVSSVFTNSVYQTFLNIWGEYTKNSNELEAVSPL